MTVKGLWQILLPPQSTPPTALSSKTLTIDAPLWILEGIKSTHLNSSNTSHQHDNPVLYLFYTRLVTLLKLNCKIIVTFEGANSKSQNSNSHLITTLQPPVAELCIALGCQVVYARGEAEQLCSVLNKRGECDFVVSCDGDCFLYGAENVVVGLFGGGGGSGKSTGTRVWDAEELIVNCEYLYSNGENNDDDDDNEDNDEDEIWGPSKPTTNTTTSNLQQQMKLTRSDLICYAILVGSDLCSGIPGIGVKKALCFIGFVKNTDTNDCPLEVLKGVVRDLKFSLSSSTSSSSSSSTSASSKANVNAKQRQCSICTHPGDKASHYKSGCTFCLTTSGCESPLPVTQTKKKKNEKTKTKKDGGVDSVVNGSGGGGGGRAVEVIKKKVKKVLDGGGDVDFSVIDLYMNYDDDLQQTATTTTKTKTMKTSVTNPYLKQPIAQQLTLNKQHQQQFQANKQNRPNLQKLLSINTTNNIFKGGTTDSESQVIKTWCKLVVRWDLYNPDRTADSTDEDVDDDDVDVDGGEIKPTPLIIISSIIKDGVECFEVLWCLPSFPSSTRPSLTFSSSSSSSSSSSTSTSTSSTNPYNFHTKETKTLVSIHYPTLVTSFNRSEALVRQSKLNGMNARLSLFTAGVGSVGGGGGVGFYSESDSGCSFSSRSGSGSGGDTNGSSEDETIEGCDVGRGGGNVGKNRKRLSKTLNWSKSETDNNTNSNSNNNIRDKDNKNKKRKKDKVRYFNTSVRPSANDNKVGIDDDDCLTIVVDKVSGGSGSGDTDTMSYLSMSSSKDMSGIKSESVIGGYGGVKSCGVSNDTLALAFYQNKSKSVGDTRKGEEKAGRIATSSNDVNANVNVNGDDYIAGNVKVEEKEQRLNSDEVTTTIAVDTSATTNTNTNTTIATKKYKHKDKNKTQKNLNLLEAYSSKWDRSSVNTIAITNTNTNTKADDIALHDTIELMKKVKDKDKKSSIHKHKHRSEKSTTSSSTKHDHNRKHKQNKKEETKNKMNKAQLAGALAAYSSKWGARRKG